MYTHFTYNIIIIILKHKLSTQVVLTHPTVVYIESLMNRYIYPSSNPQQSLMLRNLVIADFQVNH